MKSSSKLRVKKAKKWSILIWICGWDEPQFIPGNNGPHPVKKWIHEPTGKRVVPESIERGPGFLAVDYDLAPPPPSSPFSHSVCHRLSLLAGGGGGEGVGEEPIKMMARKPGILKIIKNTLFWVVLTGGGGGFYSSRPIPYYSSKVGSWSDTQRRRNRRLFFFSTISLMPQTWRSRPLIFSPTLPALDFKHSLCLDPNKCQKNLRWGEIVYDIYVFSTHLTFTLLPYFRGTREGEGAEYFFQQSQ